jgi:hypothetical protein
MFVLLKYKINKIMYLLNYIHLKIYYNFNQLPYFNETKHCKMNIKSFIKL